MTMPACKRLHDGTLRARITDLRNAVTDLLAGNYLPSFTDHSVTHSDCLCDLIDKLTEPLGDANQLSPKEAFVLYGAAYLHDTGLQHQRANETEIVGAILNTRFPGRDWDDLELETRRTIVREQHHRISGEMITRSINAPHPSVLGIQLTDDWHPGLLRALSIAHNLRMDSDDRGEYHELTKDWGESRMSLLSALLRLADILDESRRRSKLQLQPTRELPLESKLHWWRHFYVAEVEIDPRERLITLWFDFPPARREQYREMIPPLQLPWIRDEFSRHAEVLARNNLLWHFKQSETPAHQSTAPPMDDELERFVIERLARQRGEQAERDRLLVLDQLKVARPTIERNLAALRAEGKATVPDEKLKGFRELASHLYRLGGRRDAWLTLLDEYRRLANLVDRSLRMDVAMELAEMMFDDGASDQAMRLLHDLDHQANSLPSPVRFRFVRLLARGYLDACAYSEAKETLQQAADLAPDTNAREEQLAALDEARMLQGDFGVDEQAEPEAKRP